MIPRSLKQIMDDALASVNNHDLGVAQLDPAGKIPVGQLPTSIAYTFMLGEDGCNHIYQQYHGFSESYRYCTKCDHKETQ
jgi:hypothetical protein